MMLGVWLARLYASLKRVNPSAYANANTRPNPVMRDNVVPTICCAVARWSDVRGASVCVTRCCSCGDSLHVSAVGPARLADVASPPDDEEHDGGGRHDHTDV